MKIKGKKSLIMATAALLSASGYLVFERAEPALTGEAAAETDTATYIGACRQPVAAMYVNSPTFTYTWTIARGAVPTVVATAGVTTPVNAAALGTITASAFRDTTTGYVRTAKNMDLGKADGLQCFALKFLSLTAALTATDNADLSVSQSSDGGGTFRSLDVVPASAQTVLGTTAGALKPRAEDGAATEATNSLNGMILFGGDTFGILEAIDVKLINNVVNTTTATESETYTFTGTLTGV